MDDWVRDNDVKVTPDVRLDDETKLDNLTLIVAASGGPDGTLLIPEAKAMWDERLPELSEGRTHVLIRTSTAAVISSLLNGGWVPRRIRNEAEEDWRATLLAERARILGEMRDITARLHELEAEHGVVLAEADSLSEAIAEYEGADVTDAAMVLDGIHRRRAQ